jgi:hypothetical protein
MVDLQRPIAGKENPVRDGTQDRPQNSDASAGETALAVEKFPASIEARILFVQIALDWNQFRRCQ